MARCPHARPVAIAITPDGKTAYVANLASGTVTPVRTATNTPLAPVKVGGGPVVIAITPDGRTAYVANTDSGTVTPIRTATNTPLTPIKAVDHPTAIAITPAVRPGEPLPAAPHRSPAPLSARVVLPSRAMTAGSSMPARVVIDNNTGHPIHAVGCLTLFQAALTSTTYHPAVAWFACLQAFTIPPGGSSYPVTVQASYNQCSQGRPHRGIRACLPNGRPPPLPPGAYHARLFQAGNLVPAPPPIAVRVTPPEPAP